MKPTGLMTKEDESMLIIEIFGGPLHGTYMRFPLGDIEVWESVSKSIDKFIEMEDIRKAAKSPSASAPSLKEQT